jgi:hypothetical protein
MTVVKINFQFQVGRWSIQFGNEHSRMRIPFGFFRVGWIKRPRVKPKPHTFGLKERWFPWT